MITFEEYVMGRDKKWPLVQSQITNANVVIYRLNKLAEKYGQDIHVSSGYRPKQINAATPGAAPKSLHISCQACDLIDTDGKFSEWCLANLPELEKAELWMEDKKSTPTWVHLQIIPPRSLRRVFIP